MTKTLAAIKALDRAKAVYEDDGYVLSFDQHLPPPFDGFVADAVARRADELVVIEARSSDMADGTRDRLARLADILAAEPGWRLDIVTYEPEKRPPDPELDDIVRRVKEAQRLVDVSSDAAAMLIWSSIEGALLRLSKSRGVAPDSPIPPRTLIHDLAIHGLLSDNQAARLDDFARLRADIAHGMPSGPLPSDLLDWLARFALAASDNRTATVEDMVEWFMDNYTSPDHAALFYDKEEGDYFWMGTGPHYPEDVLRCHFDIALDADIEEAAKELQQTSLSWAQNASLNSLHE